MRSGAFAFSAAARTQIRQAQVSAREHQKRLKALHLNSQCSNLWHKPIPEI
jgi:hypothetical protein